jgi:hypothetical protein
MPRDSKALRIMPEHNGWMVAWSRQRVAQRVFKALMERLALEVDMVIIWRLEIRFVVTETGPDCCVGAPRLIGPVRPVTPVPRP